jgi:5-methylcytosine-specific restriction protein A
MPWDKRTRHQRGYGHQWDKLRGQVLQRDAWLCVECKRNRFVEIATEVDHIVPKAKGGTDELDNLQSLCRTCHEKKTLEESGGQRRPAIGVDGWPL